MSARELIDEIKHLPPEERRQVLGYFLGHSSPAGSLGCTIAKAEDGLPIICGGLGTISSELVREIESQTP